MLNLVIIIMDCFSFVPTAVGACLVITLLRRYNGKTNRSDCTVIIMLALTYYLCYSRGVVRHSLLEKVTAFTIGYGGLCIILFGSFLNEKKKFLPIWLCGTLALQLIFGITFDSKATVLQKSIDTLFKTDAYIDNPLETKRVVIPEELKAIYQPLKDVFDATLEREQTYIDYNNSTILYELYNIIRIDRKK